MPKILLVLLIFAVLLVACGPSQSNRLVANKHLVQRFTNAINAADWDALDELLTEDFRRHSQATPDVRVNSREEFKKMQEFFLLSIPDQQITIEMLIAEGDKIAAYATYTGTQTGAMGEMPPTGKSFESKLLSIFHFEEGRIAELWVEWDNMSILSQLGLFPPPVVPSTQEMQSEPYVLKKDEGEILTDRQGRTNIVKVSPESGSRFLAMGTQRLPAGTRIMVHKHDKTEEILYVNEGSGTLLLDERRLNVEADTTIWIPPGTWHGVETAEDHMHILWFVTPPGLDDFIRGISWHPGEQPKRLTIEEIRELEKKHDSVTQ